MNTSHYTLSNEYWKLELQNNKNWFNYILTSKNNDKVYADQDYHYRILTSSKR